jgi:hypothetical protein
MGKVLESIDSELACWLEAQPVFFVATAPLSAEGHVNCSPKGGDALRILGPMEAAYLDYTGSGAETAAHVRENGRIVLMFCAFAGPPRIVRLHGTGEVVTPDHTDWDGLASRFPSNPGMRAVMRVQVARVSTSCGFSVPLMDYQADRDTLDRWALNKGEEGLMQYRAEKNARSIDGLLALPSPGAALPPEDVPG